MTTNQEGKHTPEQPFYEDDGIIFYNSEQFYDEDNHESGDLLTERLNRVFASQSSELSKREKEVERLNNYLSEANKENAKLGASLTEKDAEIERYREEIGKMNQEYNILKLNYDRMDAAHSITIEAKDKELADLRTSKSEWIESHGEVTSERDDLKHEAKTLRESNRELFEYLKYLRPFLTKDGRDTGGIDALISKSKPTE